MSEFGANNHSGEHPNESKYEDRTVRIESGFAEKLSDFWFHHRGKVIIGVIILLIAILTVSQMLGKRNNDVMVLYSGSAYLSGEQQNDIQNLLTSCVRAHSAIRSSSQDLHSIRCIQRSRSNPFAQKPLRMDPINLSIRNTIQKITKICTITS